MTGDATARQVVLVTGAAGRLGAALCPIYARTCDVAAVYHKAEPEFPSQLRRPIHPTDGDRGDRGGGETFCIQADLGDRGDVRRVVEVALAKFGRIDVVINAAADIRFLGPLGELVYQGEEAIRQLQTNAVAPVLLASAVFQACWKDDVQANRLRNRNLVNVSSQSALYAADSKGQGFYGASKAALNLLTLFQALELEPYGVRANAICPGTFRDPASTLKVANAVIRLAAGSASGEIVTKC